MNRIIEKLKKPINLNGRRTYIFFVLLVAILLDISRMPEDQYSARIILGSIRLYQRFISPNIGSFVRCRYQPTCSRYSYTVIERYGAFWGGIKAVMRIGRCNPWSRRPEWDPPN